MEILVWVILIIDVTALIYAIKKDDASTAIMAVVGLSCIYMMVTFKTPNGEYTSVFKRYTCEVR